MGFTVMELICSKCGDKCDLHNGRPEPTEVYYFTGGYVAPVITKKEWCPKCVRRVPATHVPGTDEIDRYFSSIVVARDNYQPENKIEAEQLLLNRLFLLGKESWKEWAYQHPFKGCHCACGTPTLPLKKVKNDSSSGEEFVHPNCGGTLRWNEVDGGPSISWRQNSELQIRLLYANGEPYLNAEAARDLLLLLFGKVQRKSLTQTTNRISELNICARSLAIHKSPFFLLGVSTRDDRKTIVERAEERSLVVDSESCQQARSELTNPRTRLASEVAWLPGVSPRRATALLNSLTSDSFSVRNEVGLPVLAHCNLIASAFETVSSHHKASDVALFAEQFARLVGDLKPDIVLRSINEDRSISGFPEVKAVDLVEDEISLRKRVYKNSIKDALNQLHSNDLIEAITRLLESTTSNGTRQAPELVDELVGSYEVETQQFLNQEAESVDKLIAAARVSIDKGDQALKKIIDRMEGVLRNWGKVAQPLQLSFKVRGMDHEISKILAFKVRSLAVDLFNKHDNLIESNHLTQLLKELFSEVPEILERLEEDAQTLSGITTRRAETLAITPIRKLCEEVSNNAEKNPYLAHNEGQRLIVLGKSLLKTATVKSTSQVYLDARDMLAATLLHCAVAYGNESSKWEPCIHLLKEALEFANDKKLIQRLRENLAIVESNNKSLGNLDPIKSAPSLRTINGIGVTLYGKTDINPHDGSYMATYYLVFLLIPLLPLSRYRVIPRTGGYRFIGKGRLRTLDKWHIAIIVGLFFLMISNG